MAAMRPRKEAIKSRLRFSSDPLSGGNPFSPENQMSPTQLSSGDLLADRRADEQVRLAKWRTHWSEVQLQRELEACRKAPLDPLTEPVSSKVQSSGLPPGREQRVDHALGRMFFVNHNDRTTCWADPRTSQPHDSGA